MQTILVVDDEPSVRQSFRVILSDQYRVRLADGGPAALEILDKTHIDLVLLDLAMPGMHGFEVLDRIVQKDPGLPVFVVTALKEVKTAVDAIKRGAHEYIVKPFDVDEILLLVARSLEQRRKEKELQALRAESARGFDAIVGDSPALRKTLEIARRAAATDSTVLIAGETGTGKELLARAIHFGGKRAGQAFVPVPCCAIPATLIESELFGHEKGAFTGAIAKQIGKIQVADQGTLFLDEIGEMSLDAQSKLLRVLQDGQFYAVGSTKVIEADVRFVCATNRDLRDAVAKGIFREDLFYRINVIPIEMPPLRKRREDIPALAAHFLAKHAARVNARSMQFDAKALKSLAAYSWPGNIRELENLVERVLVHHGQVETITVEHLADVLPFEAAGGPGALTEFEGLSLDEATRRIERHLILRALERAHMVQSRAAELLGTTRRVLKYKMDQLGIPTSGEQEPDS